MVACYSAAIYADIFADLVQFVGIADILRTVKDFLTVEPFGISE